MRQGHKAGSDSKRGRSIMVSNNLRDEGALVQFLDSYECDYFTILPFRPSELEDNQLHPLCGVS